MCLVCNVSLVILFFFIFFLCFLFFFQAEDGIRDLVRSRGLGDVYKRQADASLVVTSRERLHVAGEEVFALEPMDLASDAMALFEACLLYTSDAADERSSVDLGGRRIIQKTNNDKHRGAPNT